MEFYPSSKEINYREIYHNPDILKDEDFEYYIKIIKSSDEGAYATGQGRYKSKEDIPKYSNIITNRFVWDVNIHDNLFTSLKEKIFNQILLANNFWKFDLINLEGLMYCEYTTENSTSLDWHMDLYKGFPLCNRKISFSIPFNSPVEYEGGYLEFLTDNHVFPSLRPQLGGVVIFPSFLMHRVTQITGGVRKMLVGFVGGPPLR